MRDWWLPLPFFVGPFEAGKSYPAGAQVQYDGHCWMAVAETAELPTEGHDAWRMVTRRGKQGKEGKIGPTGRPGRDLTQLDMDTGRKY